MNFYAADYTYDEHRSFTSYHTSSKDMQSFWDIKRKRSTKSIAECLIASRIVYSPPNLNLKRLPIPQSDAEFSLAECTKKKYRCGYGFNKLEQDCKVLHFGLAALAVLSLLLMGTYAAVVLLFSGAAITTLPEIVKEINLLAIRAIINSMEDYKSKINGVAKKYINFKVIKKIMDLDFFYLDFNQMNKKYGNIIYKSNQIHKHIDLVKDQIQILIMNTNDTSFKGYLSKIYYNMNIENYHQKTKELIVSLNHFQDPQKNKYNFLRAFCNVVHHRCESLGEIQRIRITKSGRSLKHYHFFIPKIVCNLESSFMRGLLSSNMEESQNELLEIKFEDTHVEFWKSFTEGRFTGDENSVLAVFQEARKYEVHWLEDVCHDYIERHMDDNNIQVISKFAQDVESDEIQTLCTNYLLEKA